MADADADPGRPAVEVRLPDVVLESVPNRPRLGPRRTATTVRLGLFCWWLSALRLNPAWLPAELTEMVIRVQVGPPQPVCLRHPAEDRMHLAAQRGAQASRDRLEQS